LCLIVSDIEAAKDALVAAGFEVGEIFRIGPDGPVSGPDPDRRSYFSLAAFSDPDGNNWQLQEVTTRLPGRVEATATSFGSASDQASAMRRASVAHGEDEKRIGEEPELAHVVRRVHGERADRRGAAHVSKTV
jgi:hypothetical protein